MTEARGPIWAGGTQTISKGGYQLVFVPDIENAQLQNEGKQPVYYWLPNEVRLARENGDTGQYKFSFIHFVGDAADEQASSGGLLGFSTTSAPPGNVLQEATDELLSRFRGDSDLYWGWRSGVAPSIRPAPIVSNTTSVTNLSPNADGTVPVPDGSRANGPRTFKMTNRVPLTRSPRMFSLKDAQTRSIDVWYANLQGAGPGSVIPTATNAYSGLVGSYPAALIWESFHGGTSAITVWNFLKIKVWSPVVKITIDGSWRRIQEHYSAAAEVGNWWWSADIKAEFNNLVADGTIKVKTEVDQTIPNAAQIQANLEKTKDLVFTKFMDAAQKMIFDPAPFNEAPAEAEGGGWWGWGGGVSFKLRRDTVTLDLHYEEEQQFAYLQDFPISGQMRGLYDEIQADPEAEKRYFKTIYMGDWEQEVSRAFKPIANYADPEREWIGQPVAFLSAQVGYPNADGTLTWDGHMFTSANPDEVWTWKRSKKRLQDVTNPPANWQPDQTFIKRQIHLSEPPSELEFPYARVQVEQNTIDLDPGTNGSMSNEINHEVRVESTGTLSVGPISLGTILTQAGQNVEVTFRTVGKDVNGNDHAPVKLLWKYEDQNEPRHWMLYTGQLDFVPRYEYKARVIVLGDLFSDGMEWEHAEWQSSSGSGPLIVSVPKRDAANVVTRRLPSVVTGKAPTTATTTSPAAPSSPPLAGPPPTGRSARRVEKKDKRLRGYTLDALEESPAASNGPKDEPASEHRQYDQSVPSYD